MIGIYIIKCISNNKVYIGQSTNITHRIYLHKCDLKHNRHSNIHLQSAYNKYGKDMFQFDILDTISECEYTQEKLDSMEIQYIKLYDSCNREKGFNIERGGNSKGHLSDETKHKLSIAKKGQGKGRKLSEETKALMRQNHSHYWLGKKMSDSARRNMSIAQKNRTDWRVGFKQTEDVVKKRTQCQFGKLWVHNDTETRFIRPEEKETFLEMGYVLGRPFARRNRNK